MTGAPAAVHWAEEAWGRGIEDVRRLVGGRTSTVLGLTAPDGERAVLRLMTQQPWRGRAAELLTREAEALRQLAGTAIPAPASLALDLDGVGAGSPAHLMTWLPGSLQLIRSDDGLLDALARLLVELHDHDPGPTKPRPYQSWAHPTKRTVPPWARRPALWREAFDLLAQEPPSYRGRFLHRDLHLGNLLWEGERISGVVDWVETSWGPAALDVAHAATYTAILHGPAVAERFGARYDQIAGGRASSRRYWAVMDIVAYLPDPSKVVPPWRDSGVVMSDDLARIRLEQHLAAVLD